VPAAAASGRAELRVPAAVVPGDEDRTPPADEVVAYGEASFDQLDNTSSCALEVFVRPAHRGKGLGRFLADRLTDIAREAGRTTVQTWADHASPGDGLEPLAPSTGAGAIGLDRSARFARARGMRLEQVERHSVLQVDGWPERWREALDEALTHTLPTDEVLTFEGPTPEEELEHIAELMRRMSTDIPLGGLDWEEEVWDADRVRRADANSLSSGHRRQLRTVVRDMTTGALVAHSILVVPVGRPVAWQGDTLVMKEHRGRRLGTIVKLANQLALLEQFPGTERIHTWNAVENSHMLDVNHAMGFELVALEGAWQGRIG
ncbi:MAG: GNAT family N-acetyltransferase, partial [Actinomycetales bacterium]